MIDGDEVNVGRGWELVPPPPSTRADVSDDLSVFPPFLHEGLAPTLTLDSQSPPTNEAKEQEGADHVRRTPFSESVRRWVDSGIEIVRGGRGGAFWSFAAAVGVAGVLMYVSRRQQRERELLLSLILDKDKRINQLMDEIVKMSETLASEHKVLVRSTS